MNLENSSIYFSTDLNDTVFGEPLGDIVPAIWLEEGELPYINFNTDVGGSTSAANDAVDHPPSPAPQSPVVPAEEVDVLTLPPLEPTSALSPPPVPESSFVNAPPPTSEVVGANTTEAVPFFAPSSSSLAWALGVAPPTHAPAPKGFQNQVPAFPQQTNTPFPPYTAGQYNEGQSQTSSNNTTPGYLLPSPVGSLMSLSSTPVVPTPPTMFAAPPVHVADTNHTFPDRPYCFNGFLVPTHPQVENVYGFGYNLSCLVQQPMAPPSSMPPPHTHIYTSPTRPSGVARRKRQERTSVLVNTALPYPDLVGRQAFGSNATASSSHARRYAWMSSLQSDQRQPDNFIPDYGSPGDPSSQMNTSGGKTEALANAKKQDNIKDSKANQKRLEKLVTDNIRRNAISEKINQLGEIVPPRPRNGQTAQTDILGDVLYFFHIEVPEYIKPVTDKKGKGKAEKAADRAKVEVARREFTKKCVGALATRLLGTVIPVKEAQKLVVLEKTLRLVEERLNAAAPSR